MTRYYDPNQQQTSSSSTIILAGLTVFGGLVMGAGAMYLLDPEKGQSRRRYLRDTASGAMESAEELAASLHRRAGELPGSAGKLLQQSRETAHEYMQDDDQGICAGHMAGLVLGGAAVAALAYVVTTEFSSIRRGDIKGAANHAYHRAADAATSVKDQAVEMAGRASEYFKDETGPSGA